MAGKDVEGDLESIDDDLEEIESVEELEEIADEDESVHFLLTLDEIMRGLDKKTAHEAASAAGGENSLSAQDFGMDSLISVKSEGLFPDVSFEEDGFLFTDTGTENIPLVKEGFDFDAYRKGYVDNERGAYKALLDYSRTIDAQCAVIISRVEGGYKPILSIGMNRTPEEYLVDSAAELCREYLDDRKVVGIDGAKKSSILGENWDWIAFKYVNSLLFLPLIYRGEEVYLMLGFKERSSNPTELLSLS